jgi:molybdenum cofactor cytidylyltransferase
VRRGPPGPMSVPEPGIPILILAAGASRRMGGRDKLVETVDGAAMLRGRAEVAIAARLGPVFVTLPPDRPARARALDGLDVTPVPVRGAAEGMAASLRAGIAALPPDAPAVLILLADTPAITAADLRAVAAAFDAADPQPARGAEPDGTPGHPVLLPARLFPALARLTGDAGARSLLVGEAVRLVGLPRGHATTDIDTVEALAQWRRLGSGRPTG